MGRWLEDYPCKLVSGRLTIKLTIKLAQVRGEEARLRANQKRRLTTRHCETKSGEEYCKGMRGLYSVPLKYEINTRVNPTLRRNLDFIHN